MNSGPRRIQLKRQKGWCAPDNTIKIDRSTRYGSPFSVEIYGVERSLKMYEAWLTGTMTDEGIVAAFPGIIATHLQARRKGVLATLPKLQGKNLACWCAEGEPCHGDLLLKLANPE